MKTIVFLRAPRRGDVKTRLARSIGDAAAMRAYCTLVRRVLDCLAPLENVELRFTPDDAFHEIQAWLRPGWSACPQGEGDLGVRLQAAFEDAFAGGSPRAVVIGSDCPYLLLDDLREAESALLECDLVLGPAADGGYWLIGLRKPGASLFTGVPWSTGSVLHETLQRAGALGLSCRLLRQLRDVDDEASWRQFVAGHASDSDPRP